MIKINLELLECNSNSVDTSRWKQVMWIASFRGGFNIRQLDVNWVEIRIPALQQNGLNHLFLHSHNHFSSVFLLSKMLTAYCKVKLELRPPACETEDKLHSLKLVPLK